MKPINGMAGVLVLGFATLFLLACENRMERAKRSLDEISYEVAGALPDGERFVPTETAHVQQEVADLQGAYDRKDYAAVLARAPAVLADAKDGWERAQAAMATGESTDAIATARNVKAETEAAAVALELKLPSVGQ
jgi:hypothetical protein